VGRSKLVVKVGELFRTPAIEKHLSLAMCIIKPDRMIEAVKAAVQLGVTEIIPVVSERTQAKSINIEKFNKSIIQATEQCERFMVPVIREPLTLSLLLDNLNNRQLIFANEEEKNYSIKDIKLWLERPVLLIGPEGGFTKGEKEAIQGKSDAFSVSLGQSVLRAEIAAISALACIRLLRG
jgi:16S rRNA (uracil1498-N3)-methyltransferase